MAASEGIVLVTGGSGFIGIECIRQLLDQGYRVRTTVRNLKREPEVRETLKAADAKNTENLEFVAADLTDDKSWPEAVQGCTYVLHVASPFPPGAPKNEDELIIPAREGTLRVLRAAQDAGVKRVIVTSSYAAIGYSADADTKTLTEKDWSDPDWKGIAPYQKSKTLAERAAWDFINKPDCKLEMATVNPVGVFGPVYGKDYSTSILLVERVLNGSIPGCPQIHMGVVDVRDVADLHIRAMISPKAPGERFFAVSGDFMTIQEMSLALRKRLGRKARKAPTRNLPNIVVKMIGIFDNAVSLISPELGKRRTIDNSRTREILDWTPINAEDSFVATAECLFKMGVLKS